MNGAWGEGARGHKGEGERGKHKPWWIHNGTEVEPWWNRSGTVVEPHAFLVEPGFSALLAPCVFAHFARTDPRPTTSFIILEGD